MGHSIQFRHNGISHNIFSHTKGQEGSGNAPQDLEINPRSPIIIRLSAQRGADAALAGTVTEQLLDNARVSAGLLEDPRAMLKRMNELLERVLGKQA
jgi:HSP90 family molecular chaperone